MKTTTYTASLSLAAWLICKGTNEACMLPSSVDAGFDQLSPATSGNETIHPGPAEEMAKKKKGKKKKSGASKSGNHKKSGGSSHPGENESHDHPEGPDDDHD